MKTYNEPSPHDIVGLEKEYKRLQRKAEKNYINDDHFYYEDWLNDEDCKRFRILYLYLEYGNSIEDIADDVSMEVQEVKKILDSYLIERK